MAAYASFMRRGGSQRERIDEYVAIGLRTPPDLGISILMMDFVAIDRRPALGMFNRPTLVIAAADGHVVRATMRRRGKRA